MSTRKQSQQINALLWLVVALAIGGYAYWDFQEQKEKKVKKEKAKLLFQLDQKLNPKEEKQRKKLLADISSFTIFNTKGPKGRQTVTATRGGKGHWSIIKPFPAPADESKIDQLLGDVIQAKSAHSVADWSKKGTAPALKKYGLDKPKHTLSFVFRKKTYKLSVGIKDSFAGKYFVLLPQQKRIVSAESSVFYAVDKKLFDLRRKEIFTQKTEDVRSLVITRATDQVILTRRKDGTLRESHAGHHHGHDHGHGKKTKKDKHETKGWFMSLPQRGWADRGVVNSLLSTLKHLRANKFVSEDAKKDKKQYGLDKPAVSVEFTLANKQRVVIHFGTKKTDKKNIFVASAKGGPIAQVDKYVLKELKKSAFELRDKSVVRFQQDAVHVVEINNNGKKFRLMKIAGRNEKWRLCNPSPEGAKAAQVQKLLRNMRGLKASKFISENATPALLTKYGLDKAKIIIDIYGSSSKKHLERLHLGNHTKEGYYATNEAQKRILFLKASEVKDLPLTPWALQGKKPPKPRTPAKRTVAPVKRTVAPTTRRAAPTKPAAPAKPAKTVPTKTAPAKPAAPAKTAPAKPAAPAKTAPAKPAARPAERKAAPAKPAERKAAPAKSAAPAKTAPAKPAAPAKTAPAKTAPAKPAARPAERKAAPAKPAVRKAAPAKPAVRKADVKPASRPATR